MSKGHKPKGPPPTGGMPAGWSPNPEGSGTVRPTDPGKGLRDHLRRELDKARRLTDELARMLGRVRKMYVPCPDCEFDAKMRQALDDVTADRDRWKAQALELSDKQRARALEEYRKP